VLPLREGRCDHLHQTTFSARGQVESPDSAGARSIAISSPTSAAVSSAALPRLSATDRSPEASSYSTNSPGPTSVNVSEQRA